MGRGWDLLPLWENFRPSHGQKGDCCRLVWSIPSSGPVTPIPAGAPCPRRPLLRFPEASRHLSRLRSGPCTSCPWEGGS